MNHDFHFHQEVRLTYYIIPRKEDGRIVPVRVRGGVVPVSAKEPAIRTVVRVATADQNRPKRNMKAFKKLL